MSGVASKDYPNYQKMIEFISKETFETQVEKGGAWIGTPDDIRKSIASYDGQVGGFESASLQVNFGMIGQRRGRAVDDVVRPRSDAAFQELGRLACLLPPPPHPRSLLGRDIPTLECAL